MFLGYAAGSHYKEQGGSSSYIYLPPDPTFRDNGPRKDNRAFIWGAEYSTPPDTDGLTLRNWDVPCAVCQSAQNGVFMLPGRDKCYDGWISTQDGWLLNPLGLLATVQSLCVWTSMESVVEALTIKMVRYSLLFRPSVAHCHVMFTRPVKIYSVSSAPDEV